MTMIYDPPTYTDSGQTPPWHGPEGPGGPGGPSGYGGGGNGPRHPVHRFRHRFLLAATAVVAGLGTFFGLMTVTGNSHDTILTTAQVARQTDPGLVDVVSTLGLQQAASAGTGLVLTPSGEILTNNHVIKGATSIRVTDIGNGRSYPAKVVGYDQSKDIAVLQLVGASGLQTVALGNSSTVQVGNKVVALGNAGGKGGTPSVAVGKVASLGAAINASDEGSGTVEHLTGLIRHTAPIQPGDSGGPLANASGQVIGMNTAASSSSTSSTATMGYAIPINTALTIAHQIAAGKSSATVHIGLPGFIGVSVSDPSQGCPTTGGTGGNGGAGGTGGFGGIGSGPGSGSSTTSGALVCQVFPSTPAASSGLATGDVITAVNGQSVSNENVLSQIMTKYSPGQSVSVTYANANGGSKTTSVKLVAGPAK
jgi:S1-C subfamily serine protease